MKTIVVTGAPGTGKTTVAKRIAKQKGYLYIDVNKLIENFKLSEGYDKKRKCLIVNVRKLNEVLINITGVSKAQKIKGLVIDSHLSHYLPKKYVDLCIVTTTDLKTMYRRLKKRGYSKQKIDENMEVEIMKIILEEAREMEHKIKIIRT